MNYKKMWKKVKGQTAEIALICGSGLDKIVDFEETKKIMYKDIGFEFGEIEGHERCFKFGTTKSGKKIVLCSRFHVYENGKSNNTLLLYQMLKDLGVKTVIATTAVGAVNPTFKAGDIMMLKGHVNMSGQNPLVGQNPVVFTDLTNGYDKELRILAKKVATSKKVALKEGVHVQVLGPSYETPDEVSFFQKGGIDTISMSTAHDCICANFFGMKFLAFASISNPALTEDSKPMDHEDVLKVANMVEVKLKKIINGVIEKL